MAEMPTMTVRVDGLELVEAIATLRKQNDELVAALTYVQAISTQQVQRIRSLEAELERMKGTA